MHVAEGSFKFKVGAGNFEPILQQFGGSNVLNEWASLLQALQPIQELSTAIPPLALRSDFTALLTLFPYLLALIKGAPVAGKVEGAFKDISQSIVKDKFLVNGHPAASNV